MDMSVAQGGGNNVDLQTEVKKWADYLRTVGVAEKYQKMTELRKAKPELYLLVNAELNAGPPGAGLKPLPTISGTTPNGS